MSELAGRSLLEVTTGADWTDGNPFDAVTGLDLARLLVLSASSTESSRRELLQRLAGARRAKAWITGIERDTLLALAGSEEQVTLHCADGRQVAVRDEVVSEIAVLTARSEADIRSQLSTARTIERSLPDVRSALAEGRIDEEKAALIARTAERIPEAARGELGTHLLTAAAHLHLRDLKVAAEQAVKSADPDGAAQRRANAIRRRAVWTSADVDGNSLLHARLASIDAHLCLRLLEDRAREQRAHVDALHDALQLERPTPGMLAVDTLVRSVLGRNAADMPDTGTPSISVTSRTSVDVQVQVDVETLAGLADHPVHVDGVGRTDMQGLLQFLDGADDWAFRRLVTEPVNGELLDFGRTTYRPPAALQRFLRARHRNCIFPGCDQPSTHADLDHAIAWDDGGSTSPDNLHPLCRAHHLLKTHEGYQLVRGNNGTWIWQTPTGVLVEPQLHPPDDT